MDAKQYRNRAESHLRKHRPKLVASLESKGEFQAHLDNLGNQAEELEQEMERQYLERHPPPEDYLPRVQHLAQANQVAVEIVMTEMILVPDEETERATARGGYD